MTSPPAAFAVFRHISLATDGADPDGQAPSTKAIAAFQSMDEAKAFCDEDTAGGVGRAREMGVVGQAGKWVHDGAGQATRVSDFQIDAATARVTECIAPVPTTGTALGLFGAMEFVAHYLETTNDRHVTESYGCVKPNRRGKFSGDPCRRCEAEALLANAAT